MPGFNDLDLKKWKESKLLTDSLWVINRRENKGKHNGSYHGNFIPQIPHQLIQRYSKEGEVVFDPFMGSGTTAYEAENLRRSFIGIDIQSSLVKGVKETFSRRELMPSSSNGKRRTFLELMRGDSAAEATFSKVKQILEKHKKKRIQFALLHPPYADIIKFSDHPDDLSNSDSLEKFLAGFTAVLQNILSILEKGRYVAIVIGDKYAKGEWIPLGFYCMSRAQKLGLLLKSVIVKNMEGNRAKRNLEQIWRYRALAGDYYIFKHEYILLFKFG